MGQSVRENKVGRAAWGLALAGCLAASSALASAGPGIEQAFAENGKVTISEAGKQGVNGGKPANTGAKYFAYQVFIADLAAPKDGVTNEFPAIATHVKWSNDKIRQTVVEFLKGWGNKEYMTWLQAKFPAAKGYDARDWDDQASRAQNAAEFISEKIGSSPADSGMPINYADPQIPKTPAAESFALELAGELDKQAESGTIARIPTNGGEYTGPEGFYLFVTDAETLKPPSAENGTAPIWVPLKSEGTVIAQKAAVPTLVKEVLEDSDGQWGKQADANSRQDEDFRIESQLPQNIGAFDKYYMIFEDQLPTDKTVQMELKSDWSKSTESLDVKLDGKSIKDQLMTGGKGKIEYSGNKLVVEIKDVKNLGVPVSKTSKVSITYKSHLTNKCTIGQEGNTNVVKLTFSNDPVNSSAANNPDNETFGELVDQTTTFTYQMNIDKRDKQTHELLDGAGFKIQVSDKNSDAASRGKWLAADGSLTDEANAYEFKTGAKIPAAVNGTGQDITPPQGTIIVPRIDEGTYIIKETTTPTTKNQTTGGLYKYEKQDSDITVTVKRVWDDKKKPQLTVTLSGGEQSSTTGADIKTQVVGERGEVVNADKQPVDLQTSVKPAPTSSAAGVVSIVAANDKMLTMPITGMSGMTAVIVYGSIAVALGIVGRIATRRRSDDDAPDEE